MSVPPLWWKVGATVPHVVVSALLSLVVLAALPPLIAVGIVGVGALVSLGIVVGVLEGPAVRVLWLARPPSVVEARLLAPAWRLASARVDVTGVHLWVGGVGHPGFAAGPHHVVLAHPVVAAYRAGRLTTDQVAGHVVHAVGRLRRGHVRFDLLVGFWTWPWDLLRGVALGIGRRLAWLPGVAFAWRIRFLVGSVAVVLESLEGRWWTAVVVAVFIGLTYLTPSCRRAWERHLDHAAAPGPRVGVSRGASPSAPARRGD